MKIDEFALTLKDKSNESSLCRGLRKLVVSHEEVRLLVAKTADWNPWPAPKFAATSC